MLYWEAKRRLGDLEAFRQQVVTYFAGATWDAWQNDFDEDEAATQARRAINERMSEATLACYKVGVSTRVFYSPPPAVGGVQGEVDILTNMFRLPSFGMGQAEALDRLDRAIGNYRRLVPRLRRKLFNPFYWIGQGLVLLGSIPFRLLRGAGFNTEKAEASVWGKMAKAAVSFITAISVALGILEKIDLLAPVVSGVKSLLGR